MKVAKLLVMIWSLGGYTCPISAAQVDLIRLKKLYQQLESNSPSTRFDAAEAIVSTPEFLHYPETAGRMLKFLEAEQREVERRYASGEGYEGWGERRRELLIAAWKIWKDNLTPYAFRIFVRTSYSAGLFGKEIGVRASRFVGELLTLAAYDHNEFVRENATRVVGLVLAEDRQGSVKLTDEEREALKRRLVAASTDLNLGVRYAVINSLALIGGRWSLDLLEQMYEREHTFHPAGENPLYLESDLKLIKEAMRKVQATLDRPAR